MSQNVSFNLVDEPWIRVRSTDGEEREVSLLELFEQAAQIKCLANDLPTQDFAILRVLLAILQRAISPTLDDDDDPAEVWGRLWNAAELPMDEIREYLDKWRSRFGLFDEEKPFMQVAGLRWREADNAESESNLKRIIADVPTRDEKRLFSQRVGCGTCRLTFPEAARWLVHLQAFDVGSPGAPVLGEASENVKRGKVYPGGMSWCGALGCLYLEGASLKDTLVLNFLPTECGDESELFADDDFPAWEAPPLLVSDGHKEELPVGRAELFTWQSRWARLIPDGHCAVDAVVSAGRKLEADFRCLSQFESMSAWRIRLKRGAGDFSPVQHSADVALWRGLSSVFGDTGGNRDRTQPPDTLSWIRRMSGRDAGQVLSRDESVRVHAVGLEYAGDCSSSSYVNSVDDCLELSPFLLSKEGEPLVALAKECASSASNAVMALGELVDNLRLASGCCSTAERAKRDKGGKASLRASTMEMGFYEVGSRFRTWIAGLGEGSNIDAVRAEWRRDVRKILNRIAVDRTSEIGSAAIAGAPVKDKKGKVIGWMTMSKAWALFNNRLRKALPLEEDAEMKKEAR